MNPVFVYYTETQIAVILAKSFSLTVIGMGWEYDLGQRNSAVEVPTLDLEKERFVFERSPEGEEKAFRKVAELYAAQLAPTTSS